MLFAFRPDSVYSRVYEVLALYRQGKRPVSKEFIAAAMDAFPGVPTQKYVTNRRPEVTR